MHKEWENARKLGNSNTLAHCFTIWATLMAINKIALIVEIFCRVNKTYGGPACIVGNLPSAYH